MTKYQTLRAAGKLFGTIKRAQAIRDQRDGLRAKSKVDPLTLTLAQRREKQITLIPLGSAGSESIEKIYAANSRLKSWTSAKATTGETRMNTNNLGNYSRRCRYIHYTYTPMVRSFGIVCGKNLWFHFENSIKKISAPFGYQWKKDDNGIKLVSLTNSFADYHPTASELIGDKKLIVANLKQNFANRKAAAKAEATRRREQQETEKQRLAAIRRAEKEGATVCLQDSLRAGNCLAGTQNWIANHKLNAAAHYTPSQILKMANGDAARVALVVTVALRRHREEMQRGYALLSDHTLSK